MVIDPFQRPEFSFDCGFAVKSGADLVVPPLAAPFRHKIHLPIPDNAYGDRVAATLQFQEDRVLNHARYIVVAIPQKTVTEPDVSRVVFLGVLELLFSLDIEAARPVEEK